MHAPKLAAELGVRPAAVRKSCTDFKWYYKPELHARGVLQKDI